MSDEQSFLDKAKDFVSDLGEDISEGIEKVGDFIEEKFGGDDAADAVKDAADSAKDAASDAVDSAKDAASDAVNSVKDAADGS